MILSKNLKQKLQESNWVGSKKVPDLKTVSPMDLSEIPRKFFADVKTEKGQD